MKLTKVAVLITGMLVLVLFASVSPGIAETKVFKIGIDGDYPPWTWIEKGQEKGFDIDVVKAIFEHSNLKIKFQVLPWETAVPALAAGKINLLLGGMWDTCEREKVIDFSEPYFWEHANLVVRKDSDINMAMAMCCGAKMGAAAGSTNFEWIKALADDPNTDVKAIPYETVLMGIKDLENGRIDAMHMDSITAHQYAAEHDVKIIGTIYMYGETAFGLEKGDPQNLKPIISEGLQWLWKSGKWAEIWAKYMPKGTSPMGPVPLPKHTKCD